MFLICAEIFIYESKKIYLLNHKDDDFLEKYKKHLDLIIRKKYCVKEKKGEEKMRELLFKAKERVKGDWISGTYIPDGSNGKNDVIQISVGLQFKIFRSTVSQFIGIRDRNGRMIFENDIVKVTSLVDFEGVDSDRGKALIVYRSDLGAFVLDWFDTGGVSLIHPQAFELEVIGNRFDNPELMKEAGKRITLND